MLADSVNRGQTVTQAIMFMVRTEGPVRFCFMFAVGPDLRPIPSKPEGMGRSCISVRLDSGELRACLVLG
jgi:hypothetical protein